MTGAETRPSGHVQVVERRSGRRWHALWRDADGRHQRVLGPAWVKDGGKRTPRGAVIWRAADGTKPDRSHLSPADAEDLLRQILTGAPRRPTRPRPGSGTRFMDVAEDWMLHGERKRGLKHGTLRDYRYTLRTHLLPAFGDHDIAAITRQDIERWHAGYPRSRTAEKVLVVLGAIMRPFCAASTRPARSRRSSSAAAGAICGRGARSSRTSSRPSSWTSAERLLPVGVRLAH
jgi:Phage integrase, N-terminal SAM-like domain